jgi:transcriptional regulator with XRE-family HTH domain
MPAFPLPDRRPPLPAASDDPLSASVAAILERRSLTVSALGSLLRAEGIAISRTRLHQLCSGTGAPPTAEQLERLASVLGVSPGYFAEYRLWRARALLDPAVVGFDRAMANFDRLRGRRDLPLGRSDDPDAGSRYPGAVRTESKERA